MDYITGAHPAMIGAGIVAVAVSTVTAYLASSPSPFVPPVDLDNQARVLEDGSHISPLVQESEVGDYVYKDATTVYEAFKRGLRVSNNGRCLGARSGPEKEYEWMSYQEAYDRSQTFGSGLIQEGLTPDNDTFLGVYSINRPEYTLVTQACAMFSMVVVPVYDTLGVNACKFIINRNSLSYVVCDKAQKAMLLVNEAKRMPCLKCLILMDDISGDLKTAAAKHNIRLLQFTDVEAAGRENKHTVVPPKPSDLAVVCYTSGTTGDPKGAMLTHQNILTSVSAVAICTRTAIPVSSEDCHISYLPLAHVFEIGNQTFMLMNGIRIGFYQGDPRQLPSDMQALKPTIFCTVPRLLSRIYDKVLMSVKDSWIKSTMLNWGLSAKVRQLEHCVIRKNSIWDKLVFEKIQNLMGGKIRIVISGSAPLEARVLNFVRSALGCFVLEGYGQTESSASLSLNIPGEFITGHVGVPLSCNRIKLVDVPDMEYKAEDGRGEICCKGPNVFKGYFKDPEKTKEAIDEDGWLHTGDIGEWLPNGALRLIDRKKNIFKLAQGEYIAPQKIETIYTRSKFVAQAYVDGISLKHYLVGVMVLDEEYLHWWSQVNSVQGDMMSWSNSQKIKDVVLKDITEVGKAEGLRSFEQSINNTSGQIREFISAMFQSLFKRTASQLLLTHLIGPLMTVVKEIYVHPELFTVENNLLTPTFKNRRKQLKTFFQSQVDAMYAKNG